MVATETLSSTTYPEALVRHRTAEIGEFRRDVHRQWRRHLALAVGLGALTCGVLNLVVPILGAHVSSLRPLGHERGLLAIASVGFDLLGIGAFAAQILLSLSAPRAALEGACLGLVALVVGSGLGSMAFDSTQAAALGLVASTAAFAWWAVRAADAAFRSADLTWYRTM
jgi:hypothetical protein